MSAADYPVNLTSEQLDEEYDWWKDILVFDRQHTLSESHVLQELHDYRFLMEQAETVYSEVTCGKMNKPSYLASDVISQYQECSELVVREAIAEALDRIDAGETTKDIREDFEL